MTSLDVEMRPFSKIPASTPNTAKMNSDRNLTSLLAKHYEFFIRFDKVFI
jgi:hypothetical protein